jgi:hypothetical protein
MRERERGREEEAYFCGTAAVDAETGERINVLHGFRI